MFGVSATDGVSYNLRDVIFYHTHIMVTLVTFIRVVHLSNFVRATGCSKVFRRFARVL
jgi:hypothetical protein